MSTDLITEIQAQPRVFAARLERAEAALERVRALETKWRTLATQSPTLFVYLGPAADEVAAALAPVTP